MISRRSFACLSVTALVVAVGLVAAEPAAAQRWRSGWGGGFYAGSSPWTGLGIGYGSPYYWGYRGSNYPGYAGVWDYYGWGSYPATSWYAPGMAWPGSSYSPTAPSYYGEGTEGETAGSAAGGSYAGQAYGAMAASSMTNQVLINMRVPPNAEVWFDDQKTSQTGPWRSFISPPLDPDRDFVYRIRVHWMENGRPVDKTRRIEVHAGDRLFVNFLPPRSQGTGQAPSGQYGAPSQYGPSRDEGTSSTPENRIQPQSPKRPPTKPGNRPEAQPPTPQPQGTTPPSDRQ